MTENVNCGDNVHPQKTSKKLTHEERMQLAAKLDDELDQFIAGLEKRRYDEGWPEDRWEEEMEKHPFFMSKPPAEGENLPPLLAGLQQLKYDTTDNTPEELAKTYKEDGNFNFKHQKYRMAVISYTEGLRRKSTDEELNAQLYNNRAASHYFLKNFRSCYSDCKRALELKPFYAKAEMRLAQSCFELGHRQECLEMCDRIQKLHPALRKEVSKLRDSLLQQMREEKRKKRSEDIKKMHKHLESRRLEKAIKARGIQFLEADVEDYTDSALIDSKVYLDDNERLVWPVIFMYPEYKTTDLIKEFHEDEIFMAQLEEVFAEPAEWDQDKTYTAESVSIYFEDSEGKIHSVSKTDTLSTVLSNKSFRVDKGTPVFLLFSRDTPAEKNFLSCTYS